MEAGLQPHPQPRMPQVLDSAVYRAASALLLALLTIGAGYLAVIGRSLDAVALVALALTGAAFMAIHHRLPAIFGTLFLSAAAVNLAGYLFDLWKVPLFFDEAVHFYTSFAVIAALCWLVVSRNGVAAATGAGQMIRTAFFLGLAVGIGWEIFEWAIGIIGSVKDTINDLLMDLLGAIAAGAFCRWAVSRPAS